MNDTRLTIVGEMQKAFGDAGALDFENGWAEIAEGTAARFRQRREIHFSNLMRRWLINPARGIVHDRCVTRCFDNNASSP